jgi:hypothetical protein
VDNGLLLHTPVRLIRFQPESSPFRAASMSLGSRRLHSRPRLKITLGFVDNGLLLHTPVRLIRFQPESSMSELDQNALFSGTLRASLERHD